MISVIISIYNRLDNLELILQGLELQTFRDFEVIISEDNNSQNTIDYLNIARNKFSFPIKHVSQEDIGFRKTRILNKAVLASSGEYLVFFDGDCVPHHKNLESYAKHLTPTTVCMGRRCYISESYTAKLLKTKKFKKINIFNLLLHGKRIEYAIYITKKKYNHSNRKILGCNWGVPKQLLIDINGFDEDYIKAGVGEDHDIDWRLRKKGGITFLNIKKEVIVYHLYHKPNYDDEVTRFVNEQKDSKMKIGYIVCKNGIQKLE